MESKAKLFGFVSTRFLHANRCPPSDQARGHASLENAQMKKARVDPGFFVVTRRYLIASGLIGEPVPPVITSGGPQNMNS